MSRRSSSDSPQTECVFFFPDHSEMNYIFRLFVVTNSAILHMDVICVSCQLSGAYWWQTVFMSSMNDKCVL